MEEYNKRYFDWHVTNTKKYIMESMEMLVDYFKPQSVIDYGCGCGFYLESALNKGVKDLKGYELSQIALSYAHPSIKKYISIEDCGRLIPTKKYDMVICVEVVEHIKPEDTDNILTNLKNSLGGVLVFSAARIGQGGTGHINLRDRSFYVDWFEKNGLVADEELLNTVLYLWKDIDVPDYIKNNLIILRWKTS